ncbi:MAG: hypothetical protein HY331_17135 [Chloroflexi bacterium]|nr:hypothetical protein [Chloroflexota bacterium]
MVSTKTVPITEAEAWLIDDLIRHTWQEDGRPTGRHLLVKVFSVLKEFELRSKRAFPPREIPIALTEDECWAVDYHVRRGFADPSGMRVGKELLLKIFGLLLDFRNEEELRKVNLPATRGPDEGNGDRWDSFQDFLRRRAQFEADGDGSDG